MIDSMKQPYHHIAKIILIILVILMTMELYAENILLVRDVSGLTHDTVSVEIEIKNDDPFISFQCDLIFPSVCVYVDKSAQLTDRKADHVLNASQVTTNRLRLFSYSLSNALFHGDSGIIVRFQLLTGGTPGTYPMELFDCIIGDTNSANILTSIENGMIFLESSSVEELNHGTAVLFDLYPNPLNDPTILELVLKEAATVRLEFLTIEGRYAGIYEIGSLYSGKHELELNKSLLRRICSRNGIYSYRLVLQSESQQFTTNSKKIIVIK
ncbi:MAG: hypothetical protein NT175_03265 [Bacteroidetes bacterium]|nr:hypothetical protein [Bacteroidota bacterium]